MENRKQKGQNEQPITHTSRETLDERVSDETRDGRSGFNGGESLVRRDEFVERTNMVEAREQNAVDQHGKLSEPAPKTSGREEAGS